MGLTNHDSHWSQVLPSAIILQNFGTSDNGVPIFRGYGLIAVSAFPGVMIQ